MTLKEALTLARKTLAANDIEDAYLVGELLLGRALKISRVQLYQSLDLKPSREQEATFRQLIKRCLNGEPVAYITGHREFYGLDFYIDHRVLIPRPETELLVEKTISLAQERSTKIIAEIGTGCGAIAISLALKLPWAKIYATDTSTPALEVARLNCQKHGVLNKICLLQGDMLHPLPEPVDFIVANLPYVRKSQINTASFEPLLALNGGPDGLEKIRRLCHQAEDKLHPGGSLLLEIGQGQEKAVANLLHSLFPRAKIEITADLCGIDRVVSLTQPPVLEPAFHLTHKAAQC